DPGKTKGSAARGQRLFSSVGCLACHGDRSKDKTAPPTIPLSGLGAKTTAAKLTAYLMNPLAVDPSGRMPHMLLQQKEAEDLAHYLCQDGAGAGTKLPEPPAGE